MRSFDICMCSTCSLEVKLILSVSLLQKPKVDGVERPTGCINPWQWRNTVTRSVAYILVAFLVCETIGNHFVQASPTYLVGDRFIPGAMWTNMLNGTINSTGLQDAYQQWASSVSIAFGDSVGMLWVQILTSVLFVALSTVCGVRVWQEVDRVSTIMQCFF